MSTLIGLSRQAGRQAPQETIGKIFTRPREDAVSERVLSGFVFDCSQEFLTALRDFEMGIMQMQGGSLGTGPSCHQKIGPEQPAEALCTNVPGTLTCG